MCVMLDETRCQNRVIVLVKAYCDTHNKSLQVSESTDLLDQVGLSSLDVMELVETLEDEFDVALPINDLADVRTVKELALAIVRAAE